MSINHELYTHYRYCRRPQRSRRLVAAAVLIVLAAVSVTATKLGALADVWPFASTSTSTGTGTTTSAPYSQAKLDAAVLTTADVGATFRPAVFAAPLWTNSRVDGCPAFNDFWVDPTPSQTLPGEVDSDAGFTSFGGTNVVEAIGAAPSAPEMWTEGVASLHCPPTFQLVHANVETITFRMQVVVGPAETQIRQLVDTRNGKAYSVFVGVAQINSKAVLAMAYASPDYVPPALFLALITKARAKAQRQLGA